MKQYQITADDLAALEDIMPEFQWACGERLNDTALRMKCRRVKEILSNVRWGYGPPSQVEIFPADDPDDSRKPTP